MCIYYLDLLDAECPQVYWEATGTQEVAACDILNHVFESLLSHLENRAQKWNRYLGTFITFERGILALCLKKNIEQFKIFKKGKFYR